MSMLGRASAAHFRLTQCIGQMQECRLDPMLMTVRWRKRRWIPIAASKLFRVRVKEWQEPSLHQELKTRTERYRTEMVAIRNYLREELDAKAAALSQQTQHDIDHDDFELCFQETAVFNKRSAQLREIRDSAELKQKEEDKLKFMMKLEQEERKISEAARQDVLKTISVSGQFISQENLSSSIEEALNKRQLYNFAIDTDGRRYIEQPDGSVIVKERQSESTSSG